LWALWESGLDWWPLAARGDVLFVLGVFMATPWVAGPLLRRGASGAYDDDAATRSTRHATFPLIGSLLSFLVVAIASWFVDPHSNEGAFAAQAAATSADDVAVPEGEWHAYGRTNFGQRYSPLAQITPDNVSQLEVAWHYETGDKRGQPGDPEE